VGVPVWVGSVLLVSLPELVNIEADRCGSADRAASQQLPI
jgi:hypothetical protein